MMKHTVVKIVTPFLLLSAASFMSVNAWAGHNNEDFCSRTTEAALRACGNDVKDDFWLAKGNCINVTDDEERYECYLDAKTEKREGFALCGDQKEAREDVCEALGEARYDPVIIPDNFVNPLQIGNTVAANTFMPLLKGFTRIYAAGDETITVTVTGETIEVQGVTCIVVRDTVEIDGVLIEDTDDWFAQDVEGNVWYFGEISRNFEDGLLSDLDGSWMAGKDGAKAGIVMEAAPQVGDIYRQEWLLAEAEDMGEVLSTVATESTPAAACNGTCLQTHDFTPVEPDVSEYKFYAPGIGEIVAYDVEEPDEREELIEYHY